MKRVLLLLTSVLLLAGLSLAQGGRMNELALAGGGIASAPVFVCPASDASFPVSSSPVPCAHASVLCSDRALTLCSNNGQFTNPLTADVLGNYGYFAAPGTYLEQITNPQTLAVYQQLVTVPADFAFQQGAQAVTVVTYSATPTYTSIAQNQLFQMTLTGNVNSSTLNMGVLSTPAFLTWELKEDGTGNRTHAYPANVLGADPISLSANCTTSQVFFWDGTNAIAIAPAHVVCSGVDNGIGITGEVRMFAGASAPAGWALCDGSSQLRTGTYASLFAVVGTTYGSADGTHFNLPDLRGRAPIGAGTGAGLTARALGAAVGEETHQLTTAELAVHSHTITDPGHSHTLNNLGNVAGTNNVSAANGGLTAGTTAQLNGVSSTGISTSTTGISATNNAGSGTAHNVMQPSLAVNFIIKL